MIHKKFLCEKIYQLYRYIILLIFYLYYIYRKNINLSHWLTMQIQHILSKLYILVMLISYKTIQIFNDNILDINKRPQNTTANPRPSQNNPEFTLLCKYLLKINYLLNLTNDSSTLHSKTHISYPETSSISSHHFKPTNFLPATFLINQKSMAHKITIDSGISILFINIYMYIIEILIGNK